jgi:hypothetical protein
MHKYQLIWENGYFLRFLTEIAHLLNHEHYDWELDIDSKTRNTRSNFIKEAILAKFSKASLFKSLLEKAYNLKIRNAIAHTQYSLVQGGIALTGVKGDERQPFYVLTFEQWEEIYAKSWLILNYTFSGLKDIVKSFYIPLAKETASVSVPVIIPNINKKWEEVNAYYFERRNRWTLFSQAD